MEAAPDHGSGCRAAQSVRGGDEPCRPLKKSEIIQGFPGRFAWFFGTGQIFHRAQVAVPAAIAGTRGPPNGWLRGSQEDIMKENTHPDYREVVFVDMASDFKFITRSTAHTKDTIEFEGKTYPLFKLDVSAESHPFYTGKQKIMDTAGRVEKFRQKFARPGSKTETAA
jgi:large subunit ribosomal protein L31